ncbi:MAG: hypothetical protein KME31_19430 [Tolypothrix carrinoi HA7290-LM1]|nr:hypothetical protein [Tolypothrix carrinoi HA7290-LM1]
MGHGAWGMGKKFDFILTFLIINAHCPLPNDGRCVTVGGAFPTHCLPNSPLPID